MLDILSEEMVAVGYSVVSATSGEAALELLSAGEQVDLLISDLSMPGMDGVTLIREAQQRRPGLPAILLTGYATNAAEIAVNGVPQRNPLAPAQADPRQATGRTRGRAAGGRASRQRTVNTAGSVAPARNGLQPGVAHALLDRHIDHRHIDHRHIHHRHGTSRHGAHRSADPRSARAHTRARDGPAPGRGFEPVAPCRGRANPSR